MSDVTKLQSAEPILITDGTSLVATSTTIPAGTEVGLIVRDAIKGQSTMASSRPVTIASDQTNLNIGYGTTTVVTGSITTSSTAVTATSLVGYSGATVSISGTYNSVNVTFEVSDDSGTTWYAISATKIDDSGCDGTASGILTNINRMWWVYWGIASQFRVRSTAWTSGSASIRITPSSGLFEPSMYVEGKIASGATDGANPLKIGGRAASSVVTSVSDGQRVGGMFDRSGRLVTTVGGDRLLVVRGSVAVTTTTETTVIAAQGAGVFCDITSMFITSLAASGATNITIRDTTAGTAVMVVPVVGATSGIVLNFNPPLTQTTANTNWTMQASGAVANGIRVFMMGIKTQ